MTKAAAKKESATRQRAARVALESNFGAGAAVKDAPVTESAAELYAIYVDNQGVPYLRVERLKKDAARYIINTGAAVEVVELDALTVGTRGLELVPEASVIDTARILLNPLTKSATISERCKEYLNSILKNEEITMAEKEKKHRSAKKATKKSAAKKSNGAGARPRFSDEAVVKLLKGPAEDQIKRHVTILTVLKENGKAMTVADLGKALKKASGTKQDAVKVFKMHQKALTEGGYISVTEAKAAAA